MENEKLNFNIVKMTESQVEAVARLEAQVFSTPWSKQALMDTLLEEHILFYTALADEDVAGYCGIYLAADEGEITLDESQGEAFVVSLRKRYDTIFRPRKFMTSYGEEITIEGGDY